MGSGFTSLNTRSMATLMLLRTENISQLQRSVSSLIARLSGSRARSRRWTRTTPARNADRSPLSSWKKTCRVGWLRRWRSGRGKRSSGRKRRRRRLFHGLWNIDLDRLTWLTFVAESDRLRNSRRRRLTQREIASIKRNLGEGQAGFALMQVKTVRATVVGKWSIAAQFVR